MESRARARSSASSANPGTCAPSRGTAEDPAPGQPWAPSHGHPVSGPARPAAAHPGPPAATHNCGSAQPQPVLAVPRATETLAPSEPSWPARTEAELGTRFARAAVLFSAQDLLSVEPSGGGEGAAPPPPPLLLLRSLARRAGRAEAGDWPRWCSRRSPGSPLAHLQLCT